MFEDTSDDQREILWKALDLYADLRYDEGDYDGMGEANDMIRELDRIGKNDERTHDEGCPHLYGIGHVQAPIPCTECEAHGWHPTRECQNCGYHLCWCVKE